MRSLSLNFKAAGAEVVSDARSVRSGFVTVGAPIAKHLALSVMSLRAAPLPGLIPTLAARLAGNWISVLLYRRCLASVVDCLFAFGSVAESVDPQVILPLPRRVCVELSLLSALSPDVLQPCSRLPWFCICFRCFACERCSCESFGARGALQRNLA